MLTVCGEVNGGGESEKCKLKRNRQNELTVKVTSTVTWKMARMRKF